ncbi:DUF4082 domain-containing protein, partial [Saccharothrix sp. MB29]|nr:DUF4082 domain-containing protein [Saccharothrix sp. MB29]
VAPAAGGSGGNGGFAYGPAGTFPEDTHRATNYWVDVVVDAPAPRHGLFDPGEAPTTPVVVDANPLELGIKFRPTVTTAVATGVRIYKDPDNTGAHVGHLWTDGGVLLATAVFTGESASGWQQADFASPVALGAGTTYVVSYHADGRYSATPEVFTGSRVRGPLTAPSSADSGGNGVFAYGPAGTFPTSTHNAANYWVDVVVRTA